MFSGFNAKNTSYLSFISVIQGHPTSNVLAAASGIQVDKWDVWTVQHQLFGMERGKIEPKWVVGEEYKLD